jgi:hypothetical protein
MKNKDLRGDVKKWAEEVGERAAQARLINAGASPNTAQKLTSGRYEHEPKPLLEAAILKAMSEAS